MTYFDIVTYNNTYEQAPYTKTSTHSTHNTHATHNTQHTSTNRRIFTNRHINKQTHPQTYEFTEDN